MLGMMGDIMKLLNGGEEVPHNTEHHSSQFLSHVQQISSPGDVSLMAIQDRETEKLNVFTIHDKQGQFMTL